MNRKTLSPLALLLAVTLFLPVTGCGKRAPKLDPRPRLLVAERGMARMQHDIGNIRSQAPGFQNNSLSEKDRYIVTKACFIRWCNEGLKPADFMRSLGIVAEDWKFMDDFYWMDPTVRAEVEKEMATMGTPAAGPTDSAPSH